MRIEHDREDVLPLTLPHSKERVELLRNATTHSSKFLATQGNHLTNNNYYIAPQRNASGKDVKELLKVKKQQMKAIENGMAAQTVMAKLEDELQNHDCEKVTVPDVDCLLSWYGIWKGEKISKSKKVGRLVIALALKGSPPTIEE